MNDPFSCELELDHLDFESSQVESLEKNPDSSLSSALMMMFSSFLLSSNKLVTDAFLMGT